MKSVLAYKTYLAVFCLMIITCCNNKEDDQEQDENQTQRVEAHQVGESNLSQTITTTANLLPLEQVEIKAPIAGTVLNIYFQEGEQVQQGSLLIRMDDRTYKARKSGLQARLSSAEKELERRQELLEIEGSSEEEVDQSRAAVLELRAQIRELQVQIDLANVKAPFGGTVGMRNFSLGAFLNEGEIITRLVQQQKIRVDFRIPAEYLPLISEGQAVKVFNTKVNDTVEAHIYAIDPLISPTSRSLQIRAMLENDSLLFAAGNFAEVELRLVKDSSALMIPAETVLPEQGGHVVYKVEKGRAFRKEVSLGQRTEKQVEIEDGLAVGDTILLTGLMDISDSARVEIKELKEEAL